MKNFRPQLVSFRVNQLSISSPDAARAPEGMLNIQQEFSFGIQIPSVDEVPIRAVVRIQFNAKAEAKNGPEEGNFSAEYLAKFNFPKEAVVDSAKTWVDEEQNQYALVSQVFPLAMTHFRRELAAAGVQTRSLPIGI